ARGKTSRGKETSPLKKEDLTDTRDHWVTTVQPRDPRLEGRSTSKEECSRKRSIRHVHKSINHLGVANTMAAVKEQWWMPQLSSKVKKVKISCNICKSDGKDVCQRWKKEYIHSLMESHRINKGTGKHPDVGEVVLIDGDAKNRCEWKKGRVMRHIKGRDGVVRGVTLLHKGDHGVLSRAEGTCQPL
ncbi:hypothetical protein QZH41_013455, partial [Actinostola sp. cb2023]